MPPWPEPPRAGVADHAACREALARGSRSFRAASLLLPPRVRRGARGLYAFCREADDAVDLGGGRPEVLDTLHRRLEAAGAGRPGPAPADRALAEVMARFAIPRALPEALLEGFHWDAEGRRYADLAELRAYAARVAGSVGVMMALVMGARRASALARAAELGVAMQLTNICRDVGEDARAGRLYLPTGWLADEGLDPEAWLLRPRPDPALARVVARLLAAADQLYRRATAGVAELPAACRPGIHAARLIYADIGHRLARQGLDPVTGRTVVPAGRKLCLAAAALLPTTVTKPGRSIPPLPETAYLVEAVRHAPPPDPGDGAAADPVGWTVDLFTRLERAQRLAGPGG